MHEPAHHDSVPKNSKDDAKSHTLPCNVAGFCVHGADGRLVVGMHRQLLKLLCTTRFPKERKRDHQLMDSNSIVICAIATDVPKADAAVGGAAVADVVRIINKWVHIGALDRGTRGFHAQLLDRIGHALTIDSVIDGEIELTGTSAFESGWEFVRYLAKDLVWCLRFFFLHQSSAPVGNVSTGKCSVKELEPWANVGGKSIPFWNGPKDIARAKASYSRKLAADAKKAVASGPM